MRIVIEGHSLPGAQFTSDGQSLRNVHVAVQIGAEPASPVPGDAAVARWELEVRPVIAGDGIDLRGPGIHGKKGSRFLYLTWGDVGDDGSFSMFRRAKLMVEDIPCALLGHAARTEGTLVASVALTDERGGPRCARVKPPAIEWRAG